MNDVILVDLESEDPRWARALPVLRELRPHLTEELFTQVMREAGPQGLRFTAVFAGERCVAIAGWRIVANTSAIRKLYIDDLCTAAADRSHGYGRMLMDELRERAVAAGCRSLELDSGVQRFDAHRFYLRERMSITAHHFDLEL
ncbi:MAG TPA: GNAT family N-acetyltransferase [Microbacterium sp.]|nr:GNAT family N-acetyltransferase [Microbacterium sp.]